MPSIFRTIGEAWTFMWRQPALLSVGIWLLLLPDVLSQVFFLPYGQETEIEMDLVLMAVQFGLVFILIWGFASTLTIGRRLLQAKAGRLRTSFKAVQGQARGLIIPLFLTDIIRGGIALLWSLPLIGLSMFALALADSARVTLFAFTRGNVWLPLLGIVLILPSIIYLIQTSLAPMVIAYEKVSYRQALRRSRQLFKGHLVEGGFAIIALTCLLLLTPLIAVFILALIFPSPWDLVMIPVSALLNTFALVLWTLSITIVYKQLGGKARMQDE